MMQESLTWVVRPSLYVLSVIFFTSCTFKTAEKKLSSEIREQFPQLVKLEPPSYDLVIGRTPSDAELALGRMLFNDPILSRNNDTSCATCHLSNHGFADGNGLSVGALGKGGPNGDTVGAHFGEGVLSINRGLADDGFGFFSSEFMFRNAISTVNVFYRMDPSNQDGLFWDGRFGSLDFQALLPIHTSIELCGQNPIPSSGEYSMIFRKKGPYFQSGPVKINQSHSYNPVDGQDTGLFHSRPQSISHIPFKRPNGRVSVPTRNECLAIAIAKIRGIPAYRELFKEAYQTDEINDTHLARALASFMMTHVALDTPYDRFVSGENALSAKQLKGLAIFMTPIGQTIELGGKVYQGAGCAECHKPPEFGGKGYVSLGVISDPKSSLTRPVRIADLDNGFFTRERLQRGKANNCHIDKVSVTNRYGPDIGRAAATHKQEDCFKFRIPPLRNIIETYPYFHHGSARAQGIQSDDLEARSLAALRQVVDYHLRGPVDSSLVSRLQPTGVFFDETYQKDELIPYYSQYFLSEKSNDSSLFPVNLSSEEKSALIDFIAFGLYDKKATVTGALGNDVSHPKKVPSGFTPSITRDHGHQGELPPNFDSKLLKQYPKEKSEDSQKKLSQDDSGTSESS